MGPWLVSLALIGLVVAAGIVVTSRGAEVTHGWPVLIAVRIVGIVLVTLAVVIAARTAGPWAAAAIGVLGVAVMIWLLVRTGYARLPSPHH